jgi:thioredoxin-dependent peroxiredoxin
VAGPSVGDRAPEFELPGSGGRTYRLADYRGTGVILAFYPGDFTPACTRQFCSYRDDEEKLQRLGVELLGISPQSVDSHERFIAENSLNVPLLADEDKSVARAYGAVLPGGLVRRSIFVIDPELIVRHRRMSIIGLGYESADDLQEAVASIR